VFLSDSDLNILDFERITDIQPLSTDTMSEDITAVSKVPALGETEALNASVGISFNSDEFISTHFSNRKVGSNAKAVLSYITSNVDSTVLRFTQDGRVFHNGSAVAGANLKKILESLVTKGRKILQLGEYYLLANLMHAPDYIKSLINSTKLKLCDIQLDYVGHKVVKKIQTAPPKLLAKPNTEVKTASPFTFYPYQRKPLTTIVKTPTKLDTSKRGLTVQQKRFNVKEKRPWYRLDA
jgi:hypothetical protein